MKTIALTNFLGLPIVAWGGLTTLLIFAFAAYIGYSNHHGKRIIAFKWHPRIVVIAFIFAMIHAIFGLSILINN